MNHTQQQIHLLSEELAENCKFGNLETKIRCISDALYLYRGDLVSKVGNLNETLGALKAISYIGEDEDITVNNADEIMTKILSINPRIFVYRRNDVITQCDLDQVKDLLTKSMNEQYPDWDLTPLFTAEFADLTVSESTFITIWSADQPLGFLFVKEAPKLPFFSKIVLS